MDDDDLMEPRAAVSWMYRRVGFGLAEPELLDAVRRGPVAELDALLAVDAVSSASAVDPWHGVDLPITVKDRENAILAINRWLDLMATTTTPVVDRMAWLWHGHFVSALDKVKYARLMVDQIRLFRSAGLGPFADLLGAVTIDPAMLLYLDGTDSTGEHPNENFGREVMELFTIGLGGYTEDDVKAGAAALTGWKVRPAIGTTSFVPRRHDDMPRMYLGVDGVHDVDTVVTAIMGHPNLAPSIATVVASELLGTTDISVVTPLATVFADSDFDIATLVRATAQAGLDGSSAPIVLAPVPWLAIAQRVTGSMIDPKLRFVALRTAGQVPMTPPNVAGWPGGAAWFGSSTVVARAQLAAAVAEGAPISNPARQAADGTDLVRLGESLGLPDPNFSDASSAALTAASPGVQRLALALCTPEFVLA
ncbi:MAG: DUF1800 family protein [Ilumatobacteraceae bacterium]